MKLKENDVVLCTVEKIEGTTVFLRLEGGERGTMILSEVAAGRIRNLREYVFPEKRVVCKILKIVSDHVELSLRRVTSKEKEQIMEKYKKESALKNILKTAGEDPELFIKKVKESYDIGDFFDEAREDPSLLETFVGKEKAKILSKMISEKSEKQKEIIKHVSLRSFASDGLEKIKKILKLDGGEVHYLGSGVFSISISGTDFKNMNLRMNELLRDLERKSKDQDILFELRKEK